jgi:dihydrofolate reductase
MSKVTADMTITLDGYGSGEGQSEERPFGDLDTKRLHGWMFDHAEENAEEIAAIVAAGAFIMGRNMFGPDRGDWDLDWQGWWGADPPYHGPTFILGHRPRPSIEMEGGTVFHFVTDGIDAALERAREAAGDKDVSIAGGPGVINQYLAANLIDVLRLHVVSFVAGGGERLFDGAAGLDLAPVSSRTTPYVTHLAFARR